MRGGGGEGGGGGAEKERLSQRQPCLLAVDRVVCKVILVALVVPVVVPVLLAVLRRKLHLPGLKDADNLHGPALAEHFREGVWRQEAAA